MSGYSQFFAGTYYYLLKLENGGKMSARVYFAISSVLMISASEMLLLWGVSLLWFHGALLSGKALALGVGIVLLVINCVLFVSRGQYVAIIKRHEEKRRWLTWIAVSIHVIAIGAFFGPVALRIYHMP
jgi:hypothetical protein